MGYMFLRYLSPQPLLSVTCLPSIREQYGNNVRLPKGFAAVFHPKKIGYYERIVFS